MADGFSIAVVTSCWGDYGKYLPEWADSIIAQTLRPAETVIVDAGLTDLEPLCEAVWALKSAGIPVKLRRIRKTSMGQARNAAVAGVSTEWAMHLDADDTLMPHTLRDVAAVSADADVVSIGALHKGQHRVYPDITAEKILAGEHGMFSCGAFRRSFWEKRPWHTRNDWIDSTFWVGLAHLGARFTSTGRVGFIYRDHSDSVAHTLTPLDRQFATRQWKLACRRWTLTP